MSTSESIKELLSYDFNVFVGEKLKLKEQIKLIKEKTNSILNNVSKSDDKTTFLISYLITTINIASDIDYLTDWSRQTVLEAMARIFLENYAEFFQLASKYNVEEEISKEINFLYMREIRRAILSFERIMNSSSIGDLVELKKSIKNNIIFFMNKSFRSEISKIVDGSDEEYISSINNILTVICNDSNIIDKARVQLSKRNGGSDFVTVAINSNCIWGKNGYNGYEILYGILSENVHANLSSTLINSQDNGQFSFTPHNVNAASLFSLIAASLEHMISLLDKLTF